jgi:hypothetical protein
MIDIFAVLHNLIGLIIVGFLIWLLVKADLYFKKDNTTFDEIFNKIK